MNRQGVLLILSWIFIFLFGCGETGIQNPGDQSTISFSLEVAPAESELGQRTIAQVNEVELIITGPDMERINKILSIQNRVASGSVELEKGNDRRFVVVGRQDDVVMFRGVKVQDIQDDEEEVRIDIPICGFDASPRSGTAPLEVSFFDQSEATGGIPLNQWYWLFGDDTESDLRNPVHTYYDPGQYTVVLGVANRDSSYHIVVYPDFITVEPGIQKTEIYYDDGSFEESDIYYGTESGVEFVVRFDAQWDPVQILAVEAFLKGTEEFDIDFYSGSFESDGEINYVEVAGRSSTAEWQSYDVSGEGIVVGSTFYVAIYFWDSSEFEGLYGPGVGLDTSSDDERSVAYNPANGATEPVFGHWGIRAHVQGEGGMQKELTPTAVYTGKEANILDRVVPGHREQNSGNDDRMTPVAPMKRLEF